jgi:replicative DNA helicase
VAQNETSKFYLHTPAQSSSRYVEWAERLQKEPGITFGCVLDRCIVPLHPGDLMVVVARPGHGKSAFAAYMAKRTAEQIRGRGAADRECVVYTSWEQPVEELEAFFQSGDAYTSTDLAWGRVDLDVVKRRAIKRVHLPVWMIGYSIKDANKSKPPLTVDTVYETIEAMHSEFSVWPKLICLDYLQIIPIPRVGRQPDKERIARVTEAVIGAKRLAMQVGCPIIACVQAARAVDSRRNPMPTMADLQHSSALEQTADKIIALWRPIRTLDPDKDKPPVIAGAEYEITEELLAIQLLKQRFDKGSATFAVRFEPQTLTMSDYATVQEYYQEAA